MPKSKQKMPLWHRLLIVLLVLVLFAGALLATLHIGVEVAQNSWEHWRPTYARVDISSIVEKETLTEEDYQTLYEQTGLTKLGVDGLREAGRTSRIIAIQDAYFSNARVEISNFTYLTYIEYIDRRIPLAILEDGDIIVSACTYVSFFRFGHSVLVVDGKKELLLESFSPGTLSEIVDVASVDRLANLMVLRPKVDKETRAQVAEYAKKNLLGIPYSIFAGIFTKKFDTTISVTQCTHVVWYAYKQFGIDLDANGGLIVKPQDIFLSDQVEVVQTFGFNPERLWS